eukprot:SAG22_NODE_1980_length_3211_cov_1.089010_1_plen_94_part_00
MPGLVGIEYHMTDYIVDVAKKWTPFFSDKSTDGAPFPPKEFLTLFDDNGDNGDWRDPDGPESQRNHARGYRPCTLSKLLYRRSGIQFHIVSVF